MDAPLVLTTNLDPNEVDSEVHNLDIISSYSKEFYEKKGLKMTILRPGPIYGPYQIYGTYHILLMLKMMGHGIVILLHPKKHRLMMPSVHITDLVRSEIDKRRIDLQRELGFKVTLSGYLNYVINKDLSEAEKTTKIKGEK